MKTRNFGQGKTSRYCSISGAQMLNGPPFQLILDILPLLPKAVVATASFAGLREGELRGLEWPDYKGDLLAVHRSVWEGIVNQPKTRASRQPVPVIPKLARILNECRASLHNTTTGTVFHTGIGDRMDMERLAQRVTRPSIEVIGLPWHGRHGFRRGIASKLYDLGANEKIVQRILRLADPHATKDRYIKVFDPAVLNAMQRMQVVLNSLQAWPAVGRQTN